MIRKALPSVITSLNIAFGIIAILINHPLWSPILILAGALCDVSDGMLARALNAQSEFGKQLDSLADLVSFGVAPAFLYFHHILNTNNIEHNWTAIIIISFIPVFSAIRLAIFNIDDSQTTEFKGLPTPANAIFFISFPLINELNKMGLIDSSIINLVVNNNLIIYSLPIVFSAMLVAPLRMFSVKGIGKGFKANPMPFIYAAIVLVMAIVLKYLIIPFSILLYILLSIVNLLLPNKNK